MNKHVISVASVLSMHLRPHFAIYYPGCDEVIVDPANTDCPPKELGDIRAFALIANDFAISNPSATAEWTSGINAKKIFVFSLARGGLAIEPQEQAGFGDEDTTFDGYAFTANIFEPNYMANWPFWNSIKRRKNFRLAYVTETQVHLTDKTVSIIPMAPIAEGEKRTAIIWNIQFKWVSDIHPRPYTRPTGVFDRAIAVS